MYFLEVILCILHPYTILQFSSFPFFSENPWLKGSLVSNKQEKLLLRLLQRSSSPRPFVHLGSTLGPLQKTAFCGWQCPQMPFAHENIKDRPSSISSSSILDHLSNLLIEREPETTGTYFTRKKSQSVESTVTTLLTPKPLDTENACRVLVVNSILAGLTWAKT